MQRIERWILTLTILHLVLLISTQDLINIGEIHLFVDPVYEYLGVIEQGDDPSLKTFVSSLIK